jgi:predicted metalloprotease
VLAVSLVLAVAVGGMLVLARSMSGRLVVGHPVAAPVAITTPSSTSSTTVAPAQPRPVTKLADHPLLTSPAALPPVDCQLPTLSRDTKQLEAYYAAALRCMERAWFPLLDSRKLPSDWPPVELRVSEAPQNSGCGGTLGEAVVAYYCGNTNTVYLPTKRMLDAFGTSAAGHLATLAHEYGHHVQYLAGLLEAAHDAEAKAANKDTAADLSRRVEMQATCFAGLFLASVAGRGSVGVTLADRAVREFGLGGSTADSRRTHGTVANQGEWARRGYRGNNIAQCNTWTADPASVR